MNLRDRSKFGWLLARSLRNRQTTSVVINDLEVENEQLAATNAELESTVEALELSVASIELQLVLMGTQIAALQVATAAPVKGL